jgi:fatty acid desaturase
MEGNRTMIESLLERIAEYGKTSFELAKLKLLDKTSDIVSSFISHSVVVVFILSFLFFLNLGIAFWLGEILNSIYYGFLIVAVFYGVIAIVFHFIMHNWIKKIVINYIIKKILK